MFEPDWMVNMLTKVVGKLTLKKVSKTTQGTHIRGTAMILIS